MKYIAIVSRFIFGVVFLFSGFVKAIDPLGSVYKIQDYLAAAGIGLPDSVALFLALALCCFEFILGAAYLFGLCTKFVSRIGLLVISGFTVLTLVIALTDPVSDCGCFGDALILTNWQTFLKNVILLVLAVVVFLYRSKFRSMYRLAGECRWLLVMACLIAGVSLYCLRHLPLLDFRPYSVGTHIPSKMTIPEGIEANQFNITLYYEKDGVVREFTEENYPWQDTTWVFKSRKVDQVTLYEPPIHDFGIITKAENRDITFEVLSDSGYSFLMISPKLEKASGEVLVSANRWAELCQHNGHRFLCLTSSSPSAIDSIASKHALHFAFALTDEITLKTIVRSNPGLILIKDGIIYAKWAARDIPDPVLIMENPSGFVLTQDTRRHEWWFVSLFVSVFLGIVIVFFQLGKRGKKIPRRLKLRK